MPFTKTRINKARYVVIKAMTSELRTGIPLIYCHVLELMSEIQSTQYHLELESRKEQTASSQ